MAKLNLYHCKHCDRQVKLVRKINKCTRCGKPITKVKAFPNRIPPTPPKVVEDWVLSEESKKQYYHCFGCNSGTMINAKIKYCPSCESKKIVNINTPPPLKPTKWFKSYYKCDECGKKDVYRDLTWDILISRRKMMGKYYHCDECEDGFMVLLYDWYWVKEKEHERELEEFYRRRSIKWQHYQQTHCVPEKKLKTTWGLLEALQ